LSVRSEHFVLCLKERHRSQNQGSLKSERAISKSDVPSSAIQNDISRPTGTKIYHKNKKIGEQFEKDSNFGIPIETQSTKLNNVFKLGELLMFPL